MPASDDWHDGAMDLHGNEAWQYKPDSARHWREAALLLLYHLRLLNWWLFLLMALGFLAVGALAWLQLQAGDTQGLSRATDLSRFALEPGVGLFAGVVASSLVAGDPLLEVTLATRAGLYGTVIWRALLAFCLLLLASAAYLLWSLANGISYAKQQTPLVLLLIWLAPALVTGALGLFGSLATRNAALGAVTAASPLAGSLFLYQQLLPIQATHPFLLSYTYSGGQDATDWWKNRMTLLGVAVALAICDWWLLQREERLVGSSA